MNAIVDLTSDITMNSLEISELVGSRHDKVKQSIERLAVSGVIARPPLGSMQISSANNRKYNTDVFTFSGESGKRDSIVVVAQLSPAFTARLVDRWKELEDEKVNGGFVVPKSFSDALRLAADLNDQNLALKEDIKVKQMTIESQAPKVEFHDAVTQAVNCHTMDEAAKILGWGRNNLFKWLRDKSILMLNNAPYQRYINDGYFRVIESKWENRYTGSVSIKTKTLVTGKGMTYLQKKIYSA